jgi:hypothetical protein
MMKKKKKKKKKRRACIEPLIDEYYVSERVADMVSLI